MGVKLKLNGVAVRNDMGDEIGRRIKVNIDQVGEKAVKGVSDIMRKGAERIKETARDMAPFRLPEQGGSTDMDQHLDRSIDVKEQIDKNTRRLALSVFINGRKIGNRGRQIAKYAYVVHENLQPEGWMQRGDGTLGKGRQAGGGFMRRAYEKEYKKIMREAEAQARKIFGKGKK